VKLRWRATASNVRSCRRSIRPCYGLQSGSVFDLSIRVAHLAHVLTADTTIRQGLRPGDIGAVTRMHGLLYEREHGLDHRIEASVAEGMVRFADAMHAGSGASLWVAEREGKIVGAIGMTDEGGGVARLRWFIVAPDARRTGVATRLLESALGWAREQELRRVVLFTIGVLIDAARLYRRAGFRKLSERVGTEWSETLVEERWELHLRG
jgi:N-acetylglutamate synthase-like GNAT family acetyltransferase